MEIKKITKVSIFIDYDNFSISYCKRYKIDEEQITLWEILSDKLLNYYKSNFIKNDFETIEHIGTYLCVGMSDYLAFKEEREIKKRFQEIDRINGVIVKYGNRTAPYRDKKSGVFRLGQEKGVDSEIICQMLMGAFLNHYDSCILMSDDDDYLPAVRRVQDYFGKKVIQAGFQNKKLRNQSYGHIPLENVDFKFNFA